MKRCVLAIAAALPLLASCGGGGDSYPPAGPNEPPPANVEGAWLKFDPAQVSFAEKWASRTEFSITGNSQRALPDTFYVFIEYEAGLLESSFTTTRVAPPEGAVDAFRLDLSTASPFKGNHKGSLKISLCQAFSALTCRAPIEGSPWNVPYDITVE